MGDATGVYSGLTVPLVPGGFLPVPDVFVTARMTSYYQCSNAKASQCASQGDAGWLNEPSMNPWWTPQQMCDNNYVIETAAVASGQLPPDTEWATATEWLGLNKALASPGYHMMANAGMQANRQAARALRQSIMANEAASSASTAIAESCMQRLQACHGQERCDYGGCVPETMQFSCVPNDDFEAELAGNSTASRVITMFGSMRVSGVTLSRLLAWVPSLPASAMSCSAEDKTTPCLDGTDLRRFSATS